MSFIFSGSTLFEITLSSWMIRCIKESIKVKESPLSLSLSLSKRRHLSIHQSMALLTAGQIMANRAKEGRTHIPAFCQDKRPLLLKSQPHVYIYLYITDPNIHVLSLDRCCRVNSLPG
jgi:hypothetical protein